MVTVPYSYTDEQSFKVPNDTLPPQNIEAEEAILGGILLDREAIYRVKDWLKAEHFYIGAHKDIYQACVRLSKKNLPTDLLHVTSWLSDHHLLERIGGRNKLATLVDRTASAVNIDNLAALIIDKYTRRELIKRCNETVYLAYDTEAELPETLVAVSNKFQSITTTPLIQTEEESQYWHYNKLLKELQHIYLKISDPGFKLYKLQELANRTSGRRVKDLEDIYLKSLCATVEPRLSLDQLEEKIGTTGRKWLLGGMLPLATTALLIADGGVGKTKWLYDLLYCIASGKNWNGFPATADSRRVLIYQGDESEHDMLQALNKRGFTPGSEVRKRTEIRFGWNTDAMPILYQDAEEFRPAVIMIDSLTFVQRYSLYDENRTEYSRAVLELNKFAAETGITVVIVHHTNKNGQARGTTAVRNAVSEVIKLEKDPNPSANPQEKILTIEKSRSRRFPASYRLFFNEEDFSFSLLEEVGQELGSPDMATKDRIIKFLQEYSNIKFEAEEVAHHISTTSGNARRCLSQLARDGLVSLDERSFSGTKKLYYIARESEYCSTENPLQSVTVTLCPRITPEDGSTTCQIRQKAELDSMYKNDGSPDDHLGSPSYDQLCKAPQTVTQQDFLGNVKQADHLSMPETAKKTELEIEEKTPDQHDQMISSLHNSPDDYSASAVNYKEGDHQRRSQGDHLQPPDHLEANSLHNSVLQTKQIEEGQVYLSLSLGKQVKVKKLFASVKKSDVYIAGDPCTITRLALSDLYPLLRAEGWKPQMLQLAMYGGELVKLVGFTSGAKKYQVEFKSGKMVYVKTSLLTCP